jgi:hypothetical protein
MNWTRFPRASCTTVPYGGRCTISTWSSSGSCCGPSRRPKPRHDIEAGRDISKVTALLGDAIDSGEGDVAEALRPLYIDYLTRHGVGS